MRASVVGAFVSAILAGGCGGSDDREFQLRGAVRIDGQAIPRGYILFDPDAGSGHDGQQGYAEIIAGRYDTAQSKKGVTGGRYVARVHGFTAAAEGARPAPLVRDYRINLDLDPQQREVDLDVPASAAADPKRPLAPPI